jgi:hypothetical protein
VHAAAIALANDAINALRSIKFLVSLPRSDGDGASFNGQADAEFESAPIFLHFIELQID